MDLIPISVLLLLLASSVSGGGDILFTNPCGELCGALSLPYPFHLNSSCGPPVKAFRLTCSQSQSSNSSLYLTLGPVHLRVIAFFSSTALLLDYSSKSNSSAAPSSCSGWFADLNDSAAVLDRSPFFAVTVDNVFRLYDCNDSSVCRPGCERVGLAAATKGCEGAGAHQGCCYPLSDGSMYKAGQGFSAFAEYGCRGFSSWVAPQSLDGVVQRGIEVEWAVPRRLAEVVACVDGAEAVNATAVKGGYRCVCGPGHVGDGFAQGIGCFKACSDDGGHSTNNDCCKGMLCKRRVAILVGALLSAMFIAGAFAICYVIKHPINRNTHHARPACLPKVLGKSRRTRLFTYQELNDATNGFDEEQQVISLVDGTIHMGVIDDGSLVAVEKLNCLGEQHLRQVWETIEILTQVSHKNIAGIVGCCIGSNHSLFLVHEFFPHGTLEDHLDRRRGSGLGWHQRVNIATEVASALCFLQSEISPPINLGDLKSREIFIGADFSIKIPSFKFLMSRIEVGSCSYEVSQDAQVAYNFGLILLELITGSRKEHLLEITLFKIKDRRFHEIVDPYLSFAEQTTFQCEQIERMSLFAAQCVAKNACERTSMVEVAKDFVRIANGGMEGSGKTESVKLEVTFSNSSLLQMVSMSPDSILVS